MADIGTLPKPIEDQLSSWIEDSGTLIRFAGPRLAGASDNDPLLPVRLRKGERALGGTLSWSEPQNYVHSQTKALSRDFLCLMT